MRRIFKLIVVVYLLNFWALNQWDVTVTDLQTIAQRLRVRVIDGQEICGSSPLKVSVVYRKYFAITL